MTEGYELTTTPTYELVISETEAVEWLEILQKSPHFWLFTITQILCRPTPRDYIQTRKGPAGLTLYYVEGSYAVATLAALSRLGVMSTFDVLQTDVSSEGVECLGKLALKFYTNGCWSEVWKTQWGGNERKSGVPLGSTKKAAATDALKKCLSQFGWASDVYTTEAEWTPPPSKEEMKDKQATSFYARAAEKGLSREVAIEWCRRLTDKTPEELSVKDLAALKRRLASEEDFGSL